MKQPPLVLVRLEARRLYGLRKLLGTGSSRESWLTRDGKVLKLPRHYKRDSRWGDQMARELSWKNKRHSWIPKMEKVTILGVTCVLMEYVSDEYFTLKIRIANYVPYPHKTGLLTQLQKLQKDLPYLDGDQFGFTHDGRLVGYDLGIEGVRW